MKNRQRWIIFSAAAALLLCVAVGVPAAGMLKGRPTAVAVVDIEKVFNSLQEKMQIEAELKARNEKIIQDKEEREKDLKGLKAELDILTAGTPGFKKKQEDLEKKVFEHQSWIQWQNAALVRENRLQMTAVYNKITGSIGKIAKDNGYDVVLFKEPAADFGNVDPKDLGAAIRSRKVLWASDELDISDQIIQGMNNDWKAGQK